MDCRITPQRLAVLKVLASSEEHLSAEQICKRVAAELPTTSPTLSPPAPDLHELRRDRRPAPAAMHDIAQRAEQETGYEIRGHSLKFYGACPRCREWVTPTP